MVENWCVSEFCWCIDRETKNGSSVHCWKYRWQGYAVLESECFLPIHWPLYQHFPASKTDMSLASKLMPLTIATLAPAEIARVFDWYSADLPQNATFQREIHRWSMFRQAILPIRYFHFGRPGLSPNHSPNLPLHILLTNRIRTMWTIFFCFGAYKAMKQNNNGREQTKRTSIIAHSQRVNVDRVNILDKFDTGK